MPDLRTDWLTGRAVLIAENRAHRPNEFGETASAGLSLSKSAAGRIRDATSCPFCPGHESLTPPPEYEQLDDAGRWRVRVIPNKYPAVTTDPAETGGSVAAATEQPATTCMPAFGAHEVIVESARHIDRTTAISARELQYILEAYAARLNYWHSDGRFAYGLIFKNQGPWAGASMAHLHSQLVALPGIPPAVQAELGRAQVAFDRERGCPYCRLLEQERKADRLVFDHDGFVAFCPFASLQAHEVWLSPTSHESCFERSMSVDALERLSKVLHRLMARIESISLAYNLLLRTAPWNAGCDYWCHWRIEILPRVNAIAGLESATGIFINPVSPERAAQDLRMGLLL